MPRKETEQKRPWKRNDKKSAVSQKTKGKTTLRKRNIYYNK